ncbi:polymorphic toxin type 50 domain-containing protein [Velocimicrobium porci]|uniref:polymorphic toxin type 50 domain-containing protein n=1 Tax=Velocimicrobium porci TaxID=2606634 RepID=UPI0012B2B05D
MWHNNYTKGRSYLSISLQKVQELVNKYAGTGELKRDNKGNWSNKEFVVTDKIVGVCIDPITGKERPTTRFSIHYFKRGGKLMLSEKELLFYHAQGKKVRIICIDGTILEGKCTEYSTAYDNDPEEASITLKEPLKNGILLPWVTEVMEHEIKKIEYLN